MGLRLRLLSLLVACLAFAQPSSAKDPAQVEEVVTSPIQARKVKVGAGAIDIEPPGEVTIRPTKVPKADLSSSEFEPLSTHVSKVPKVSLEGIPELPKKIPPDEQDIADQAAQKAEQDQGGPGAGAAQTAEPRAEYEASVQAEQQALKQGREPSDAHDIGEATRARVQEDYARAADGGSLTEPPAAPKAAPAPAQSEVAPVVLEPPPSESGTGDADADAPPEAQVIDVPQTP